jgi:hypothetical protein
MRIRIVARRRDDKTCRFRIAVLGEQKERAAAQTRRARVTLRENPLEDWRRRLVIQVAERIERGNANGSILLVAGNALLSRLPLDLRHRPGIAELGERAANTGCERRGIRLERCLVVTSALGVERGESIAELIRAADAVQGKCSPVAGISGVRGIGKALSDVAEQL